MLNYTSKLLKQNPRSNNLDESSKEWKIIKTDVKNLRNLPETISFFGLIEIEINTCNIKWKKSDEVSKEWDIFFDFNKSS
jgi:ABC-type dipeptide/oligopeptide/nickel transport system ATPase component